ncbi:glycine/D-amino acid oxidase-like deaminating enzyme [Kribbella voronezhensis]|uniref:Glycine/D-amino acid oxidase-like deaminating enzyme n=1 Tax=Kribbella voronezhensis TaxID=2512212 RepID=A0A4R7TCB4_9ACTN|nr:FAD-binding oxidoreductase [Kribbella voronezhensis]TDU89742.1 glycine/D-amino acid oxidase-like deaminating enzyme [Kribbella voronezhensis]
MGRALSRRGTAAGVPLWAAGDPAVERPILASGAFGHAVPGAGLDRAALPGDRTADIAIVGAGYTGLWTAYYLLKADPKLRIVVLEAETAGFGASGRNGGWCSALFPVSTKRLASLPGSSREAARAMHWAMQATVNEIGLVTAAEHIDCDYHKGGTIVLARTPAQLARARAEVAEAHEWGPGDLRFLEPDEVATQVRAKKVLGATFTPHCAAIHPGRLVRGLAATVERLGGVIHEHTPVTAIEPGRAITQYGVVRAEVVVRATEGFTPLLAGQVRTVAPVYSLMVATEPLSDVVWERIGLAGRPTFSDHRHLIIYGQRTADGRLAFGGRGAPYHFRSRIRPSYDDAPRVFAGLRATLRDMFDGLDGVEFTHAWGGPLGVPRDWCASVGLDRGNGLAWAGGYVGDGVATTNLAGRTLTDLILRRDTDLTRLPWVGHRSRPWEPEPLRWLGINAGLRAMTLADTEERLTGRESRIARWMRPLLGG